MSVSRRVIMLGLDGFEKTIADRMIARGELPAIARLFAEGANAALDHGDARNTGLSWEHVATGLSPDDGRRWSAVDFDPRTYAAIQRTTNLPPFAAALDCRTVVFDAPYFDLPGYRAIRGVTNWGAHDPGVPCASNPLDLNREIQQRFGPYPAKAFIYGYVWPSARRTRQMADCLIEAAEVRSRICQWLLGERFIDWDLAIVVAGECHSAIEALWHGVDPEHPLHGLASAGPAREGIEGLYRALDRLIGELCGRFPDALMVAFNYHGMGPNASDVPSMALLPELLHRAERRRAGLRPGNWPRAADGSAIPSEDAQWSTEVLGLMPPSVRLREHARRIRARFIPSTRTDRLPLAWMPSAHYAREWPLMRFFAPPAFYGGQVRLNLCGRERHGRVAISDYDRVCDEVERLLAACTNPSDGSPVVERIRRTPGDPLARDRSQADLTVVWKPNVLGFSHPVHGTIGPLPWRRTGGHTGGHGFACFTGPGVIKGDLGLRAAFDIPPTVIELLGSRQPQRISGRSFAREVACR